MMRWRGREASMRSGFSRVIPGALIGISAAGALVVVGLPVRGVNAVPRVVRRLIGQPVDDPEMRSMRIDSAFSASARSSPRFTTRAYFTPADGLNSNVVTTGPG